MTEAEEWARLAASDDQVALEQFIQIYPTGPHTEAARNRLAELYAQSADSYRHGTAREDDVTRPDNAPFGAVAIPLAASPDGYAAVTWNEKSVGTAAAAALKACKSAHGSCRIAILYRRNQCAAVAADGRVLGWAKSLSSSEAEAAAFAMCTQKGGSSCAVNASRCNASSLH